MVMLPQSYEVAALITMSRLGVAVVRLAVQLSVVIVALDMVSLALSQSEKLMRRVETAS